MCDYCEIHKKAKKLINGQYYCFDCLSVTDSDKPVRYENLSALNKMPNELQNYRFKNVFSDKSKVVKSFEKFTNNEQILSLDFNFLWVTTENYLDTHKIAASIANERLVRHLPAEYLDLNTVLMKEATSFSDNGEIGDLLDTIESNPFHCVVLSNIDFMNKISISRFISFFNAYLKSAILDGNLVVIVSDLKLSHFMETNQIIRNLLNPYKDMIKEVSVRKGELNNA